MWTTVARAPLAEREGRARAVLRARRTSHNVSSRRSQSAPKARQIEAAAKERGDGLDEIPGGDRVAVLSAYPRIDFKRGIVRAFSDGFGHKPTTTFASRACHRARRRERRR